MLTGLDFEIAQTTPPSAPNRADIACFVGFVARRPRVPLPPLVQEQLRSAGWIAARRGARATWQLPPERPAEDLLHLPVIVDAWETFDLLFDWEGRTVHEGRGQRCATYLGAAVRSYFAQGGRRAVIVRTGDPWPYLGGDLRTIRRAERLAALVPASLPGARPFEPHDPRNWRGFEHVYALREVSHVCLPDLADVCATEPPELPVVRAPAAASPDFAECSPNEPALPTDNALRSVGAPRLGSDAFAAWARAVDAARQFLVSHRKDVLLLAALPLPEGRARSRPTLDAGAFAQSDLLQFLEEAGVLRHRNPDGTLAPALDRLGPAASAFVQLVWPWLQTARSSDLPQQLEPGEGVFAGLLAGNALGRGTFRSVAGSYLPDVVALEPTPDLGLGPESPTAQLAQRVCLIGPEPDGIALLSDVTSTPHAAWRSGGVSRLMSALVRAALRTGESEVFEANGPELWGRVRGSIENLLDGFYRAGALGGRSPSEAFSVRCDLSTMTQNDLDNGRVRVEITVLPASAIARITVSLELAAGGADARLPEVA